MVLLQNKLADNYKTPSLRVGMLNQDNTMFFYLHLLEFLEDYLDSNIPYSMFLYRSLLLGIC